MNNAVAVMRYSLEVILTLIWRPVYYEVDPVRYEADCFHYEVDPVRYEADC